MRNAVEGQPTSNEEPNQQRRGPNGRGLDSTCAAGSSEKPADERVVEESVNRPAHPGSLRVRRALAWHDGIERMRRSRLPSTAAAISYREPPLVLTNGGSLWLGNRDSNPNYLIQSQAFYR
jgi:hypothetical protein